MQNHWLTRTVLQCILGAVFGVYSSSLQAKCSIGAGERASELLQVKLEPLKVPTDPKQPLYSGSKFNRGEFDTFFNKLAKEEFEKLCRAITKLNAEDKYACEGCDWLEVFRLMKEDGKTPSEALARLELNKKGGSAPALSGAESKDAAPPEDNNERAKTYRAWLKDKLIHSPYGQSHRSQMGSDLQFIESMNNEELGMIGAVLSKRMKENPRYCVGCYLGAWGGFGMIRDHRSKRHGSSDLKPHGKRVSPPRHR